MQPLKRGSGDRGFSVGCNFSQNFTSGFVRMPREITNSTMAINRGRCSCFVDQPISIDFEASLGEFPDSRCRFQTNFRCLIQVLRQLLQLRRSGRFTDAANSSNRQDQISRSSFPGLKTLQPDRTNRKIVPFGQGRFDQLPQF